MQPAAEAAMYQLSEGSLEKLMRGEKVEGPLCFQILGIKTVVNYLSKGRPMTRYILEISDGRTTFSMVMLWTPLNDLVHSKTLTEFSIVIIHNHMLKSTIHNGEECVILIITHLEVLVPGCQINKILGNVDMSFLDDKMQQIELND